MPNLAPYHSSVQIQRDQNSAVGSLFAGHRRGWWGVEAGVFSLPKYRSQVSVADYPAYRAAAGLPMVPGDNTRSAEATQTFGGHALYLRGNIYGPRWAGFTPYAFAGIAQATTRNREQATYNGGESSASNDQTFRNRAPIFGLGLQRDYGRLTLRAEYLRSDGLQDNSHTLKRRIELVTVGLAYRF